MLDFEFSDDQKDSVEEFYDSIDSACYALQEQTSCPDEIIDQLLVAAIGSWQIPSLEQLEEAIKAQDKEI